MGRGYKAPDFIDPRMLDPKHAFRQDYEQEGKEEALFLNAPEKVSRITCVNPSCVSTLLGCGQSSWVYETTRSLAAAAADVPFFRWCLSPVWLYRKYRPSGGQKGLSIFHKKYEQHNKRHRQGYAEDLGMSLSRVAKVRPYDSGTQQNTVQSLVQTCWFSLTIL